MLPPGLGTLSGTKATQHNHYSIPPKYTIHYTPSEMCGIQFFKKFRAGKQAIPDQCNYHFHTFYTPCSEDFLLISCKSLLQQMVRRCVDPPWRADCHCREPQVGDGVGDDGGRHNWPLVRACDHVDDNGQAGAHDCHPGGQVGSRCPWPGCGDGTRPWIGEIFRSPWTLKEPFLEFH